MSRPPISLQGAIDALMHNLTEDERRPMKLAVVVHAPGSIGGTPASIITSVVAGFDWDQGTILITTADRLTRLSAEDVEAIRLDSKKAQSPAGYQMYKRHKEVTDELKAQVAQGQELLAQVLDQTELHLTDDLIATIKAHLPPSKR